MKGTVNKMKGYKVEVEVRFEKENETVTSRVAEFSCPPHAYEWAYAKSLEYKHHIYKVYNTNGKLEVTFKGGKEI